MATATFTDPYTKPPFVKRFARVVLPALHRLLPAKIYHAFYHSTFNAYQWLLRRRYQIALKKARSKGDQVATTCKERVLAVMPYSLIGSPGLEHTHDLAQNLVQRKIEGSFVECGVAQGGCAALISMVAANEGLDRNCWFFDSFEGLPDPTNQDFSEGQTGQHIRPLPRGSCLGTYEQVSQLLFSHFGLSKEHITLAKGWFEDTLPVEAKRVGQIALLRIDGDWYESTKCCLETLYDQVSDGGYLIIDDYCSCFGARKATDEFIRNRDIQTLLVPDGRGGCSFKKPYEAAVSYHKKRTVHAA